MTADQVLNKTLSITLNASGAGEGSMGPSSMFERWRIDRMVTEGSSVLEPSLNVYRNSKGSVPIDFTPFGNQDISETTTTLELPTGEFIIASYTGGSSGAVMRFKIEGLITYPGTE